MASPEAIFEREAVRSYMVADLWTALGHDIDDPRVSGHDVDMVQLWAELCAEVRAARAEAAALRAAIQGHIDDPSVPIAVPAVQRLRAALDALPAQDAVPAIDPTTHCVGCGNAFADCGHLCMPSACQWES